MAKSNGGTRTRKSTAKSDTPNPERTRTTQASTSVPPPAAKTANPAPDGERKITEMPRPRPSAEELHEAIRKRAYEIYCQRGQQGGNPEDDWHRAEREVLSRFTQRTA